jgi:hypothetical protein
MLLTAAPSGAYSEVITTTVPGVPNIYPPYTRPLRARIEKEAALPADVTIGVLVCVCVCVLAPRWQHGTVLIPFPSSG